MFVNVANEVFRRLQFFLHVSSMGGGGGGGCCSYLLMCCLPTLKK